MVPMAATRLPPASLRSSRFRPEKLRWDSSSICISRGSRARLPLMERS